VSSLPSLKSPLHQDCPLMSVPNLTHPCWSWANKVSIQQK
jgi:hypothetical protein